MFAIVRAEVRRVGAIGEFYQRLFVVPGAQAGSDREMWYDLFSGAWESNWLRFERGVADRKDVPHECIWPNFGDARTVDLPDEEDAAELTREIARAASKPEEVINEIIAEDQAAAVPIDPRTTIDCSTLPPAMQQAVFGNLPKPAKPCEPPPGIVNPPKETINLWELLTAAARDEEHPNHAEAAAVVKLAPAGAFVSLWPELTLEVGPDYWTLAQVGCNSTIDDMRKVAITIYKSGRIDVETHDVPKHGITEIRTVRF